MTTDRKQFSEAVSNAAAVNMQARQEQLRLLYLDEPDKARVIDCAQTRSVNVPASGALYSEVFPGHGGADGYAIGVHKAVGGMGDYPVPGDILCAAIASCLDTSIRIIANRLGVRLARLQVNVQASVDVRGTLKFDKSVAVGFTDVSVSVDIEAEGQVPDATISGLLKAAEQSCVVIQTLRHAPRISVNRESAAAALESA